VKFFFDESKVLDEVLGPEVTRTDGDGIQERQPSKQSSEGGGEGGKYPEPVYLANFAR
jgi:hypothetical protein